MIEHYEGIHYLNPTDIHFWTNEVGQLCARLGESDAIEDVLVFRTYPVTDPNRYISVRTTGTQSEQHEIGVLRNLNSLAMDQRRLLNGELAKRYFLHIITKIRSITVDLGYYHWDCDTDKGRREFSILRWNQRKVYQTANGCRVITDVDENRYEIPDIEQLDAASQALFRRHIYW